MDDDERDDEHPPEGIPAVDDDDNALVGEDIEREACAICLQDCADETLVPRCLHAFCFGCILQWSEVARACPLCKQPFSFLLQAVSAASLPGGPLSFERHDLDPLSGNAVGSGPSEAVSAAPPPSQRRQRRAPPLDRPAMFVERELERALAFRRAVYANGFRVKHVGANYLSKFRELDPERFRRVPSELQRLRPWIRRDLHCFMAAPEAELVLRVIEARLVRVHPQSEEFVAALAPYLRGRAEHFAHELASFARSPYGVQAYDDNVVYDTQMAQE